MKSTCVNNIFVQDQEKLEAFIAERYNNKLSIVQECTTGGNWGDLSVNKEGTHLSLLDNGKVIMDVPLELVKNCTKQQKAKELVVELNDDEFGGKNVRQFIVYKNK